MSDSKMFDEKPRCNCGIFGIFGHPEASVMTYYGLHALQHRGQEASGIVARQFSSERKKWKFAAHKGLGLVMDVFYDEEILKQELSGESAIGHNRYSTTGASKNKFNIQPLVVNYKSGNIALSHNGNLTNFSSLRNQLQEDGTIFQSTSDSEIFLHLIARSKQKDQILQIKEALETVQGAFSLVILTDSALIAARDPFGFRPLVIGRLNDAFVVASESCAFDIIGAEYIREVNPAEVLVFDDDAVKTGKPHSFELNNTTKKTCPCIFEYIYFSRPDSKVFGENVDKVRRKLGKQLAQQAPVKPQNLNDKVIIISVPDSSNSATLGFVTESNKIGLNVKPEIGLIRSHYVGRTFIQPEQKNRELRVKSKFNTVKGALNGRTVVIVDDSIVRGTTSKQLVKLIREANPKEIHFRVTSPPIRHPCQYGMDFPSHDELIANRVGGDVKKIEAELAVDSLAYLSIENLLIAAPKSDNRHYCTACFTGEYPIEVEKNHHKELNDS